MWKEVESSPEYREAVEIERSVLRDVARRHTDAERGVDGEAIDSFFCFRT